MSRRRNRWHRSTEQDTKQHEPRDFSEEIARWVTSYLEGSRPHGDHEDRDTDRRAHARRWGRGPRSAAPRGPRRGFDHFDGFFEDGDGPSEWPDEVHEHLAALRDRLHGISARHDGRRRGRDEHRRASGRSNRVIWALATRLAVMVIMAVVARKRADRSRRRRGFSV